MCVSLLEEIYIKCKNNRNQDIHVIYISRCVIYSASICGYPNLYSFIDNNFMM